MIRVQRRSQMQHRSCFWNPLGLRVLENVLPAKDDPMYNLRNEDHLRLPVANTTTYELETIEYRGCLLWSTLPPEIKDSKSLSEFKRKIQNGMEILASADYVKFMLEI